MANPSQTDGMGKKGSGRDQQQEQPPDNGPEGGARRSKFDPSATEPHGSNDGAHNKRAPRGGLPKPRES